MSRKPWLLAVALVASTCYAFSPSRRPLQHGGARHFSRSRGPRTVRANSDDGDDGNGEEREGSLAAATRALGQVPYGETSRKYRRTVFRHGDWVAHRSSSRRTLSNLRSMFFSGVVRQLRPQVTAVSAVAAFALAWNGMATTTTAGGDIAGFLPGWDYGVGVDHLHVLALPTLPFTLSSPALGLLLVFRTNAAYARWICGRDAWARITSHGKNLVRMTSVFSSDADAVEEFSKVVWLYCRTVMNKLSSPFEDEEAYREEVREVFRGSSVPDDVLSSSDRVIAAWKELSVQLHSLPADDPKALIETDKSIIILGECTSTCEKIYSSPVPLVYTRHTARFLSLWALSVPLALYSAFDGVGEVWAVLPASAILAFFLFGVDELAMQLEEPFSILPMQVFCDEVRDASRIMVGREEPGLGK